LYVSPGRYSFVKQMLTTGAFVDTWFVGLRDIPTIVSIQARIDRAGLGNFGDHDRSAARGEMSTRGLYVFKHESELGDASAHALFDLVQVAQTNPDAPARSFADFTVTTPAAGPLEGFSRVTLERIVG
jgi:hypothetical protein